MEFAAADGDAEALELRGAGRSIHLHATDPPEVLGGVEAEWLIEFTDDGFNWARGHGKATVALRGGLTDLLLVFYRRLPHGQRPGDTAGGREAAGLLAGAGELRLTGWRPEDRSGTGYGSGPRRPGGGHCRTCRADQPR